MAMAMFAAVWASPCSQYVIEKDCMYAPEPRCVWETVAGINSSCVCAVPSCEPIDLCVLEAVTAAACDKAVLPNGAPCRWNSTGAHCSCEEVGCPTRQPTCTVDEHCEDDCDFPCECAAGHCYLVDGCGHFDGEKCASSMWHGARCCPGQSTGSDKGCFLCDPQPLCKKKPRPTQAMMSETVRAWPLGARRIA